MPLCPRASVPRLCPSWVSCPAVPPRTTERPSRGREPCVPCVPTGTSGELARERTARGRKGGREKLRESTRVCRSIRPRARTAGQPALNVLTEARPPFPCTCCTPLASVSHRAPHPGGRVSHRPLTALCRRTHGLVLHRQHRRHSTRHRHASYASASADADVSR